MSISLQATKPLSAFTNLPNDGSEDNTWKPLKVFSFYRLLLASFFVISVITGTSGTLLGEEMPLLFRPTALIYLVFAVICIIAYKRRSPSFTSQVYCQVLVDTIAITLVMHSCGGIVSGMGTLLVVAIAAGSILMAGRMASFFAAVASISILMEQFFSLVNEGPPNADFTKAGFLGATFFATAVLSWVLARRITASDELVAKQIVDLANMAELNEHIIQHMQSGVIAVDSEGQIRLMNESSKRMLDWESKTLPESLKKLSPELDQQLNDWRRLAMADAHAIRSSAGEVIPRFNALGLRLTGAVLIFLDDATVLDEQAHQIRLAALGRLTGGIAHEIRNPLGAISHAAQLLDESPDLGKQDQRLLEIIHNHSARMNEIIENILQLSRGSKSLPEPLVLKPWLDDFISDFLFNSEIKPERLTILSEFDDMQVRFNLTHLNQIVTNLCQNAIRHGTPEGEEPRFDIHIGINQGSRRPFLEIIDYGKGIPSDEIQQIFDPFYSTHSQGTGLGLYIAREMCGSNRARLDYKSADQDTTPGAGGLFRITFSETEQPAEQA